MRLRAALLVSTALAAAPAAAQTRQPASLSITPSTIPEVLQVLDAAGQWVPMGQVDQVLHRWISQPADLGMAKGLSVNAATLVGDGYWGWADATYTSGGTVLTSASRVCASGDIGKVIVSAGGGISGGPYHGKMTGCGGQYAYGLDTVFGTSLSATSWAMGTDNSAALAALATSNAGQCIYLPAGAFALDATNVPFSNLCVRGQGILASRISTAQNITSYGTTIMLMSPTVFPFSLTYTGTMEGVNFVWPGEIATSPTSVPFAYPALLSPAPGRQASDLVFAHNAVINAYDIFKQQLSDGALGNLRMENNILVGFHSVWDVAHVGEEMETGSNNINTGAYPSINTAQSYAFKKWSLQNGHMMIAEGNGVGGGTCSTGTNVLGQNVHNNIIDGYQSVFYVPNGWLDESHFSDNDLNAVQQILQVDAGGVIRGADFKGLMLAGGPGSWQSFGLPPPTAPAFNLLGTCTNLNTIELNIHGRVTNTHQAGAVYIGGTNTAVVNMSGEFGLMALSAPAMTQNAFFMTVDDANAKVNVSGAWLWNKEAVSSGTLDPTMYNGFLIKQAKSFNLSASIADTWNSLVDLSQLTTTSAAINIGNVVTTNTTGPNAVVLPTTCNNVRISGMFDKQLAHCWPAYLSYPTTTWTSPQGAVVLDVVAVGPGGPGGGGAMSGASQGCSGGAGGGAGKVVWGSFALGSAPGLAPGPFNLVIPGPTPGGAGATVQGPGGNGVMSGGIGQGTNFAGLMSAPWGGGGAGGQLGSHSGGGGGATILAAGGDGSATAGGTGTEAAGGYGGAGAHTLGYGNGAGGAGGTNAGVGQIGGEADSGSGGAGAGGGIDTSGVDHAGGTSGPGGVGGCANCGTGGAPGVNGGKGGPTNLGALPFQRFFPYSGGGGGSGALANAGNGGDGNYGAGGGGGGCSRVGFAAGNGGAGGGGLIIVNPRF